jgi:hypothetical protein
LASEKGSGERRRTPLIIKAALRCGFGLFPVNMKRAQGRKVVIRVAMCKKIFFKKAQDSLD